ncbi:cysteine-rich RLK (RECEPTOR-like protein kinase) 8 [Hibiscus trionum]|uniref:Cysteine-rich RLK (RECEPTOR-like protein kinase) 8 n=1 Tax=Hibiscus trionum TaxID=183268 RepID=A0A9W7HLW6_HIBTR|nr:cysteine-rich RLK (RECEPTOR-like protein kinase) 8 [Hibiscus trionum]
MKKGFEMNDFGKMSYFLGIEILQLQQGIFICQRKYAIEVLKKFRMENCKTVNTPAAQGEKLIKNDQARMIDAGQYKSLIGCLLYLSATRPDIMYATSLLSRFMHSPSEVHYRAAKRILRYIKGTTDFGVLYARNAEIKLVGFTDSDWACSSDDMRSTSGYCFFIGSGMICWSSKKPETVAQSTAKAEYVAAAHVVNQCIWLRKLLLDLKHEQVNATEVLCDNKSAVAIAKNPVFHGKTKHINIKYHFLREVEKEGQIQLKHCSSEDQVADIFTKGLPKMKFEKLRESLRVCSSTNVKEE